MLLGFSIYIFFYYFLFVYSGKIHGHSSKWEKAMTGVIGICSRAVTAPSVAGGYNYNVIHLHRKFPYKFDITNYIEKQLTKRSEERS